MKFHQRFMLAVIASAFALAGILPGQSGTINTIAGLPIGDGGPATSGLLLGPSSAAFDSLGNLYIADGSTHRIRKVTPGGVMTTVAGTGSQGYNGDGILAVSATLAAPVAVALDSSDNLYITDTQNNRIRRVDAASGLISTIAGNGTNGFSGDGLQATTAQIALPSGIAVSSSGDVYFADYGNYRIRKISGGIISTVAGTGDASVLNQPYGVALNAGGTELYIADRNNNRICKLTIPGFVLSTVAGVGTAGFSGDAGPATAAQLNFPTEIAFTLGGDLLIADTYNHCIRKVIGGTISTIAGTGGTAGFSGDTLAASDAKLSSPGDVSIGPLGLIYIVDSGNARVRKIDGSGIITTVAGNGAPAYNGDSIPATTAALNVPSSVVVDTSGNVYVSDTQNARVRRIRTDGVIETYAGIGTAGSSGDNGLATLAQLRVPRGLALDATNNLYIADSMNHKIRRVDRVSGNITTVAGNGTGGFSGDGLAATLAALNNPYAIAFDAAGNMFIADKDNNRVRKVAGGIISTVAGTVGLGYNGDGIAATSATLFFPAGVAVDGGNLYIADTGNNRVRKVSSDNVITTFAGTGGPGFSGDGGAASAATLYSPSGLALTPAGAVLIADSFNYRVRSVTGGVISTLAGNGIPGYSGDGGPATSASLSSSALGVAADSSGNAYIADTNNNRVRKVSSTAGTVAVTVTTSPSGLSVIVDSLTLAAPAVVNWLPGSLHTIAVASPQLGAGSRYIFANWSDSGAISHSVTAPSGAITYSAAFITQYQLALAANPGSGGTISANPASGDGYYNAGTTVQVTASPILPANFTFFSGDLSGSTNPQNVVMNGSRSVVANFSGSGGTNAPPYAVELSPFQGAGVTQIFTGTYNDNNGWTDIAKASIRFYESYAGLPNACIIEFRPPTSQLTLLDDAGVNWLSAVTLGSATPLQNSACSVNAQTSSFSGTGNTLTVNFAVTFKPAFGSAGGREPRKAVCLYAKDAVGAGEDQSCLGLWVPETASPSLISRYRLYNPANFAHFFTASQNERDVLVTRGFTPEDPPPGMAYNQPATVSGISTHPFYRILFFPQNGAPIFHYWTRDREEYKAAVRIRNLNLGEGIDSFLLSGQAPGTYPTYRLRFTAGPTAYPIYHYALQAETDALIALGWGVSLGVDGYLQPVPLPGSLRSALKPQAAGPAIGAVLNAASHESGAVAPGQLVRVYGSGFSKLAQVLFDGQAVPALAMTERYIEVAVPESAAGKDSIAVLVDDLGQRTEAVTLQLTATNPAVFVKDFLGRGLADTLESESGTVTLQLTGAGDLRLPVEARIAGHPAEVLSVEPVAGQVGRFAVKLRVPPEALAQDAESGTVSVQIGEAVTQPGVLVRLK